MNQVDSIVQAGANQPPVAMSIAGSDPGAGAGAQVDLKTFSAHGVFGVTAISAVTVQNTCEVRSVHIVPPHIVGEQIRCLVDDFNIISAKTGMLATRETIEIVGNAMVHSGIPHWVIDPVLVSSSGSPLLENGAHESYLAEIFPRATLVTPNSPEASLLAGIPVNSINQMEEAARILHDLGAKAVLVKGGHLGKPPTRSTGSRSAPGRHREGSKAQNIEMPRDLDLPSEAVDVFFDGSNFHHFSSPWVSTTNTHGTGCTLSAGIASQLALGHGLFEAVDRAKKYVTEAIQGASKWSLGSGHGPLDHFGWNSSK